MNQNKLRIIVDNWALQAELVKKYLKNKTNEKWKRSYYNIFNKLDKNPDIYINIYTSIIHIYICIAAVSATCFIGF